MKLAIRVLFLLVVLGAGFAYAQIQGLQNIFVIVQENRTPDNLFQDQTLINAGADIRPFATGGLCYNNTTHMDVPVQLIPRPLADCVNPDHSHAPGWKTSYRDGNLDGACQNTNWGTCDQQHQPPPCPAQSGQTYCPQYAYVDNTSISPIQPYFQIAEKYGFANYMFQTSEGPSFPAHQFLLSGTSASSSIQNPYYAYFAAENPNLGMQDAGCAASDSGMTHVTVPLISPPPADDESIKVYPCFEHPTLTDLLDSNGIMWRWYSDQANSIWTAPNAISHICNNSVQNGGGSCGSGQNFPNQDWINNVKPYLERAIRPTFTPTTTLAPFLQDLQNCNFPNSGTMGGVYFVVPDGRWSDHPVENLGLGPDYVASIVNLIGRTAAQGECPSPKPNWGNAVVLITWDDWGGWYDHVSPAIPTGPGIGYPNNTGGQYVYGFRVPLLVVSTFAKQHYISSPKNSQTPIYYDFGSILRFIEKMFLPSNTFINTIYPYADQFVTNVNDLSDFFDCSGPQCHPFQSITLVNNSQLCNQTKCMSNQCDATCFINYPGSPKDPDDQ